MIILNSPIQALPSAQFPNIQAIRARSPKSISLLSPATKIITTRLTIKLQTKRQQGLLQSLPNKV
jgi:hypothetical protein